MTRAFSKPDKDQKASCGNTTWLRICLKYLYPCCSSAKSPLPQLMSLSACCGTQTSNTGSAPALPWALSPTAPTVPVVLDAPAILLSPLPHCPRCSHCPLPYPCCPRCLPPPLPTLSCCSKNIASGPCTSYSMSQIVATIDTVLLLYNFS